MMNKDESLEQAPMHYYGADAQGNLKRIDIHFQQPKQPEPPPQCVTEAEKTAFAFGWFKALETQAFEKRDG